MAITDQIKDLFDQLEVVQQYKLLKDLTERVRNRNVEIEDVRYCPHCKSERFHKHGKSLGKQRFLCMDCKHTFATKTDSINPNIRKKSQFEKFRRVWEDKGCVSIASMAKKIGISIPTAHRWLHMIISNKKGDN